MWEKSYFKLTYNEDKTIIKICYILRQKFKNPNKLEITILSITLLRV